MGHLDMINVYYMYRLIYIFSSNTGLTFNNKGLYIFSLQIVVFSHKSNLIWTAGIVNKVLPI